jgi:uncharacterized membrane protein YfcA
MFASLITDPVFYAVAIPSVVFLGLSKGGLQGLGTAATPLLALYLPPLEAAALLLPILITQDAISVYVYRREWDAWNLKVMLPGAMIGMAAAWAFAAVTPDDAIRILIGVVSLAFVLHVWLRPTPEEPQKRGVASGMFWGALAGFASFASQGGGPPYQVHMLPQRLPKLVFVGTTTIFFTVINAMKIVPYAMLDQFSIKNLATSVILLPVAILANFGGIWLVKSLPTKIFYRITYVLLVFLGSLMLWQGVSHLLAKT